MDLIAMAVPLGMTAMVGTTGWLVRKIISTEAQLNTHEKTDSIQFANIAASLIDLKNGQRNQTEKLDRIVEHMLP